MESLSIEALKDAWISLYYADLGRCNLWDVVNEELADRLSHDEYMEFTSSFEIGQGVA